VYHDVADNGEVVLEKLTECIKSGVPSFDLLLLDINMPILSGLEVIKYIRSDKNFKNIHVITVTGYTEERDITMYLEAGCDSYLSKPVKKQDFFDKVIPLMLKKHKINVKDVGIKKRKPISKSTPHILKLDEQKQIALRKILKQMKKNYVIFDPQEIRHLWEELKTIIPEENMSYYSEKITSAIKNYDDEILKKLIKEMEEAYV
jgi:CheY-like chemotaxis protein